MAETGFRTVHHKGEGPVIRWARQEWRPAGPTITFVGQRVWVGLRAEGDLCVKPFGRYRPGAETWTTSNQEPNR